MSSLADDACVDAVRRFNRFYTRQIGLLRDRLLDTTFSLTEARVLYEIGQAQDDVTATSIAANLGLDQGYLSRLLKQFIKAGLITRKPLAHDRRQALLALSARGRATFRRLDRGSYDLVAALLTRVPPPQRPPLMAAMRTIETTLAADGAPAPTFVLRPHRAGDMGYVLESHARLYAQEQGWGTAFEVLVAGIVHAFLRDFDPARERCLIAEMDGVRVGSIFIVKGDDETAKLRLLLIEPQARGSGLARRLVEESLLFARAAQYRRVSLWTQSILGSARALYERMGFRLVRQEPHCSFGHHLAGETWEYDLAAG